MRGLDGKAAIVTGGANGIGKAIVERLCQEGVSVTFSGISEGGVATEQEFKAKGYRVQFIRGDMAEEAFCRHLVDEAERTWGKINYLVNNAFSFIAKGIDATREEWLRALSVGPIGYATMTHFAVPKMRLQGGGAIVNLSSISAHIAQPTRWTYNAGQRRGQPIDSLHGVWIWRRKIFESTRLAPVGYGPERLTRQAGFDRAKWGPIWGKFHMLRRLGEVEECAGPVAFLLSDEASFITATEVMVDGGYHGMGSEGIGEASSFAGSA